MSDKKKRAPLNCLLVLDRTTIQMVLDLIAESMPVNEKGEWIETFTSYHTEERFKAVWAALLLAQKRGPWDWESVLEENKRH